jgi:hypothetical protein
MSHRIRARGPAQTPIERIFVKVMHRKMNVAERMVFHLDLGKHHAGRIHGVARSINKLEASIRRVV